VASTATIPNYQPQLEQVTMSNIDRRALTIIACLALFILPMTIHAATMGRSYDQHITNPPTPGRLVDTVKVLGGITSAPICAEEDEIGCVFVDRHDDSDPTRGIVDNMDTWWTCVQSVDNGAVRFEFRDTSGQKWVETVDDASLIVPNPITCANSGV
jgi:hypothetical protein